MKKFFFVILIIFFNNKIAFSQGYGDQFIKLEGCGYGFSAYINLQSKTLDLNGDGIYNGRYKIKFENSNHIETKGKYFDRSYPTYRITKRTGIIRQLNPKITKVYCAKVNGELTDYGQEIAKKEKLIKEADQNNAKQAAKKPGDNYTGYKIKFCLLKSTVTEEKRLPFPIFDNQKCKKFGRLNHDDDDYYFVDYNLFSSKFNSTYGRSPNICFDKEKKVIKAALSCKFEEIYFKYNKTDGKIYSYLSNEDLAIINSVAKKTIVVKKPDKKIPTEEKPISKKPEKKIAKSAEVDASLITIGSGSGFYINNKGYALTNNHVIDICKQSIAVIDGKETLFRVIATDKTNDVAVLKTDLRSRNYIRINEDGAKLGENVIAVGYPLAGRLSDSVKITRGIVSSTSGLNNNIGQIQIDAALQPGNSGGPVLNENGELVGIASAGLNKLLMAKEAKYIPENVNFAVASPIVVNILKSKKIKYSTPSMFSGSYSNTELAELGNSSTIQLFCRNTRTAYNRLKSSNKYSTVLLDLD